jgi:hypothetical protein
MPAYMLANKNRYKPMFELRNIINIINIIKVSLLHIIFNINSMNYYNFYVYLFIYLFIYSKNLINRGIGIKLPSIHKQRR